MWTEEKLKAVAKRYEDEVIDTYYRERRYPGIKDVFLAGCKYIINNTQKEQ